MLLYSEYLLRHSFISQSRLDVTSFVICLNLYSKHGKVLFGALLHYFLSCPSLSRHTWRACSSLLTGIVDFTQWTTEFVPPICISAFELQSQIHNWCISKRGNSQHTKYPLLLNWISVTTDTDTGPLFLCRKEGHTDTNPDWNDAKNYWCFMWNKGRKTVHINQFTPLSASRSDPSGLDCSQLWTFFLLCSTSSSEALRWS